MDSFKISAGGYVKEMVDYTLTHQLKDRELWALFVNQFRIQPDAATRGWRGEFWGKMMRGGALTYRATGDEQLYAVLAESVEDLISAQEKSGRISTYAPELEFTGWDMWCRKYVMLGMLYFYDVCKSDSLKNKIIDCLKAHADYIIDRIGEGEGKTHIFRTAAVWGAMNSCSILEPFCKLYVATGEGRYLDFAKYIVDSGMCEGENLIESALAGKMPYTYAFTKAYEMMSCFEGLLEYYKITGNERHLAAVQKFVEAVVESDFTVIGCCGCKNELFDNSALKQCEYSDDVMQETCVTVTFEKLCFKLFLVTGDVKYIAYIERSALNAMFGAVNDTNQTMANSQGRVWTMGKVYTVPHESYPFDSYGPLYMNRRGRVVGGFMTLQDGRSYGCCACIGSAGTAIAALAAITRNGEGFCVNIYTDCRADNGGNKIEVSANPYLCNGAEIAVEGDGVPVKLRVPEWAQNFEVTVDGAKAQYKTVGGYVILTVSGRAHIGVAFTAPVTAHVIGDKVAFTRGPVALCRDCRLDDIKAPVGKFGDGESVECTPVKNSAFRSNITVETDAPNGKIKLCDYASAGKNYDEENSLITVWQDMQ